MFVQGLLFIFKSGALLISHVYFLPIFFNAAYDSVLAGGGDGTLNHVLDALVRKRLRESGQEAVANRENPMLLKPNITVGVLPVSGAIIHSCIDSFIVNLNKS